MTDDVSPTCRHDSSRPSYRRPSTRPSGRRRCDVSGTTSSRQCLPYDRNRPSTVAALTDRGYLDVTVIDLASHTAYLEPFTGTGFLVLPPCTAPHNSDWEFALAELDDLGWFLLDDETGQVESAGHTADDRLAVCLYAETAIIDDPSQAHIHRALTALRLAAQLHSDSR